MRTSNPLFLSILSTKEIGNLTSIVKETIAVLPSKVNEKFTAAELWNISKSKKAVSIRRFM